MDGNTFRFFGYALRDTDMHMGSDVFLTFNGKKSTHLLHKTIDNRHSESQTTRRPVSAGIRLIKFLIDHLEFFLIHADARILHIHTQIYAIGLGNSVDMHINAAFFGKFDPVANQMPQDLLYFVLVTDKRQRHRRINIKNNLAPSFANP